MPRPPLRGNKSHRPSTPKSTSAPGVDARISVAEGVNKFGFKNAGAAEGSGNDSNVANTLSMTTGVPRNVRPLLENRTLRLMLS